MKRIWHRPQLIALARGNPADRILSACKVQYYTPAGPYDLQYKCYNTTPGVGCYGCSTLADS